MRGHLEHVVHANVIVDVRMGVDRSSGQACLQHVFWIGFVRKVDSEVRFIVHVKRHDTFDDRIDVHVLYRLRG